MADPYKPPFQIQDLGSVDEMEACALWAGSRMVRTGRRAEIAQLKRALEIDAMRERIKKVLGDVEHGAGCPISVGAAFSSCDCSAASASALECEIEALEREMENQ